MAFTMFLSVSSRTLLFVGRVTRKIIVRVKQMCIYLDDGKTDIMDLFQNDGDGLSDIIGFNYVILIRTILEQTILWYKYLLINISIWLEHYSLLLLQITHNLLLYSLSKHMNYRLPKKIRSASSIG